MEGILRSDPTMPAQSEGWKTGVVLSTPMTDKMACRAVAHRAVVKVRLRTSCFGVTALPHCVWRRLESRAG